MTYVYDRVSAHDMIDRARKFDRLDQLGGPDGVRALFDHLEELAEGIGEPIELDIIALCCEWAHYASIEDAAEDYDPDETDPDEIRDWFDDNTIVLDVDDGSVLIRSF
jgi:hypothetical protein